MDKSTIANYIFSYSVVSNAQAPYNFYKSQDFNVSITCGAETIIETGTKQIEIKLEKGDPQWKLSS